MSDPFEGEGAKASDFVAQRHGKTVSKKPCDWSSKKETKKKPADLNKKQAEWFKENGYAVFERVEIYNAFSGFKSDLWGFGDFLALRPPDPPMIVQTTSEHNWSTRYKKMRSTERDVKLHVDTWLACGGRIQIHTWYQPKGPGTLWELRKREVTEDQVLDVTKLVL